VVGDDRHAAQRLRLLLPLAHRLAPARRERREALLVGRRVGGVDLRQPRRERGRDLGDVARIEVDVRIAAGVDVALAAIDARRHLERRDEAAGLEVGRRADGEARIARLLDQERQPADLELHARADEQVGVPHARDQARPRLDVMRVLQRRRRRRDVDLVAAELLDERRPLGLAGDDVERGLRRHGGERGDGEQRRLMSDVMAGPRRCAHHGHRGS
jgi:hypothetical protein